MATTPVFSNLPQSFSSNGASKNSMFGATSYYDTYGPFFFEKKIINGYNLAGYVN
jgi:hypothetical protein